MKTFAALCVIYYNTIGYTVCTEKTRRYKRFISAFYFQFVTDQFNDLTFETASKDLLDILLDLKSLGNQ